MLLVDTHVLHWITSEPARLSKTAARAVERADALAVASISWYELARMVRDGRIEVDVPLRSWLADLAIRVRTLDVTPAIAESAASLPPSFPRDPADRLIYATALEHGLLLVTKDERMRAQPQPRQVTVW